MPVHSATDGEHVSQVKKLEGNPQGRPLKYVLNITMKTLVRQPTQIAASSVYILGRQTPLWCL